MMMLPHNPSSVRRDIHVAIQITLLIGLLTLLAIGMIQSPPDLGWIITEFRHTGRVKRFLTLAGNYTFSQPVNYLGNLLKIVFSLL